MADGDGDGEIVVNRAPVLTLWAAIVAERLGHDADAAITLGRAVAGSSARIKARAIGLEEKHDEEGRGDTGTPMRAFVAYYRVSTDKQGQSGLGLDAQRAAVELHARSVGAEVIAEFQDVESGRKADRAGLAAALAMCRAKRATLLIAKLDRLARSVAFISNLMEGAVDFVAADMPSVNQLTVHVLAAVAEHEREMISQRTRAALAAAKVRGTRLGNPRLPATGTLAAAPAPSTPGARSRAAAAQARAVAAYGPAIAKARSEGALSLGDYVQALQAARLPAPQGSDRWSRASVARVLRYCRAAREGA